MVHFGIVGAQGLGVSEMCRPKMISAFHFRGQLHIQCTYQQLFPGIVAIIYVYAPLHCMKLVLFTTLSVIPEQTFCCDMEM